MIGLDTNVLVRLLMADDKAQTVRATQLLKSTLVDGRRLHINTVVLVESIWVLQRIYGAERATLQRVLDELLENAAFDLAERSAVEAARRLFGSSRADFADCLIAVQNENTGCLYTATFDRDGAKLPAMKLL